MVIVFINCVGFVMNIILINKRRIRVNVLINNLMGLFKNLFVKYGIVVLLWWIFNIL